MRLRRAFRRYDSSKSKMLNIIIVKTTLLPFCVRKASFKT